MIQYVNAPIERRNGGERTETCHLGQNISFMSFFSFLANLIINIEMFFISNYSFLLKGSFSKSSLCTDVHLKFTVKV